MNLKTAIALTSMCREMLFHIQLNSIILIDHFPYVVSCVSCFSMVLQSLGFYNSNKVLVSGLSSLNSQFFNINLDGCQNTRLEGVKISAPENSPNTDGIHVQSSSGITITNSHIGTGDDCISLGPGCSNMWVENINCGPGHGIRYQNRKLIKSP